MLERSFLFRLLVAAALCAPCACATTAASQAEVGDLRKELHSLREVQSRLLERLERLENRDAVSRARAAGPSSPSASTPGASETALSLAPSELSVVRLKPKSEPAPRLPTAVAVVEPDPEQMEMFISDAGDATASTASTASKADALPDRDPAVLEAEFEHSVSLLRTGNVEGGVERLTRFAQENPRHPRADNALYFSGLGQMGLKDIEAAAKSFERLIDTYPAGDAVLDGMLRLAECRVRLNQAADARALYTRVVTQFPGTAAATQAEQRLAALSP